LETQFTMLVCVLPLIFYFFILKKKLLTLTNYGVLKNNHLVISKWEMRIQLFYLHILKGLSYFTHLHCTFTSCTLLLGLTSKHEIDFFQVKLTIETCAGHRDYQSEKNVADRSNFNKCVWHLICFNCSYCCKIREMIMRSNFMGSKLSFFMRSKVLKNWSWDRNWHFSGDQNFLQNWSEDRKGRKDPRG